MYRDYLDQFSLREGRDVSRVYGTADEDSDFDYIAVTRSGPLAYVPRGVASGKRRYSDVHRISVPDYAGRL